MPADFDGQSSSLHLVNKTTIRVRYGETDAMGVVYYGNYALYFEIGRNEIMRSLGLPYGRLEQQDVMMPVVDLHIEYKNSAYYDDLLEIETGFLELKGPTVTFGYIVRRIEDEKTLVTGTCKLAFVDKESRKPVRPPRTLLEKLKGVL